MTRLLWSTPYRRWRIVAAALAAAALGLAACTSSGGDSPRDPQPAEPTSTLPVTRCLHQALFELVSEELAAEEFLDRVHEDDAEIARALFRPDDHPQAGEYIPLEEWGEDQQRAWGVFITAHRQMDDLLPMLFERLTEDLTPNEFFAQLDEEERYTVRDLAYPEGHPNAGEFVATESVGMSWESYLLNRPAGPGCPW